MPAWSIQRWIDLLRSIGAPGAPSSSRLRSLALDADTSWTGLAPFLHWRARRSGIESSAANSPISGPARLDLDSLLWRACADDPASARRILDDIDQSPVVRGPADAGALTPQGSHRAIEVWTETELASLHALWWLAELAGEASWRRRALEAARWHLIHLQPDNATNRPWAIHIFAHLASRDDNDEASAYAQTLLHNCQVHRGGPDEISSLILMDAAEALAN